MCLGYRVKLNSYDTKDLHHKAGSGTQLVLTKHETNPIVSGKRVVRCSEIAQCSGNGMQQVHYFHAKGAAFFREEVNG